MTKGIWLSFLPSGARLKNSNAERRRSRSLALWICEASVASNHKLAKARGCFEGTRQCILSRKKTTPSKIPIATIWPRNFYPPHVTKYIVWSLQNILGLWPICDCSLVAMLASQIHNAKLRLRLRSALEFLASLRSAKNSAKCPWSFFRALTI